MRSAMFAYRRHLPTCRYSTAGRRENHRCQCPVWCDGLLKGRRFNRSLRTADWTVAQSKLHGLERGEVPLDKPLSESISEWLKALTVEPSTKEKYTRAIEFFAAHLKRRGVAFLATLAVEDIDAWRTERKVARGTMARELQTIRLFLNFAEGRNWIKWNPAKRVKIPQGKQTQVQPFTAEEYANILKASMRIGRGPYERLRARTLVMLLRYTALRLGDALKLSKDRIQGLEMVLYTEKAGTPVWLPIPNELREALEMLPRPRGAADDSTYFFWNGLSKPKTLKSDWDRTLRRVFASAGVPEGHAHRFRHTLAVQLLQDGATLEEVARVLGNTPGIVARHYAPWCQALQTRVRELMRKVHQNDSELLHRRDTEIGEAVKQWKQ